MRVLRGGVWVATDPTLEFAADGKVVSKAATVSVSFSGGGTGPLLTGVKDGRTLSLSWPKALPKPTLAANVATYANVLPDVDLQVKAEVEGFSQLLVVKTAVAAANPELASLKFKLDTVGLNVSTDTGTGAITAVNPAGQTVFTSPSPLMWDSTKAEAPAAPASKAMSSQSSAMMSAASAGETPADVFTPPAGAQDAHMPTTVANGTLEIKPDQALLTGAQTQYPVFIDPSWAWGDRLNWTRVYKKYPSNSYWNSKDDVRVGYENETNGLSRSFFQIDTSNIKGTQVNKSTLRVRNTWSWSCQARPVQLWNVGAISSTTTWNNQPAKLGSAPLATVNESKGWGSDCAAGNLEFDATALVRQAAAGNWSSVTVGLFAGNESDTFGWKRFDPKTLTIETEYNNPPATPSALGTDPATSCTEGGLIGNTAIGVYATIDDPDGGNLQADFQVFKPGQSAPVATASIPANRGQVATWAVPTEKLPTGDYTWNVRAKDQDGNYSGWSTTCKFTVDRTRPSKLPLISSVQFPEAKDKWPDATGPARTQGTFTFDANGENDVKQIWYYTDFEPRMKPVAPGGSVAITPPGSGPHSVYAYSVDQAGNRSDTQQYTFYANRSQQRDAPGDLNGDGFRDIWTVDAKGQLYTYAGQGNSKFTVATSGGVSFTGSQTDTRGDWGTDGYNDLVSLHYVENEKKKVLSIYPNDGRGTVNDKPIRLSVSCPVKDEEAGCFGDENWTGDDHWYNAEQMVTPGDINGDGMPDLLVKQGKQLWAYYGNRAQKSLDMDDYGGPILVGNGDWDKLTVIAPGDVNGDGIADLWLRDNTTGDIFRTYGSKGVNGKLDPTTWGNPASRVKIGTSLPQSSYPELGSVGDITGDTFPDLWARKADGKVVAWPGKAPDANGIAFGGEFVIDTRLGTVPVAGNEVGNDDDRVRWADFDGDGKLDYVTLADNGSVSVSVNNGGDAAGGWKWLGQVSDGLTTDRTRVRLADFDGDGKADYQLINPNGSLTVQLNKGGGASGWKSLGQVSAGQTTDQRKVRLADFDGDGRSDYLTFADDGAVSVWLNKGGDGAGGWQALGKATNGFTDEKDRVRWADYDGDGKADYYLLRNNSGLVEVWLNKGGDTGGGWQSLGQVSNGLTPHHHSIQFGAFNGDANADFIISGVNGSATVYGWNGGDNASGAGWLPYGKVTTGKDPYPSNSGVFFHASRPGGGEWSPFGMLNGVATAPNFQGSQEAVTSTPDGSLQVLGAGTDGNLYHRARFTSGNWTPFELLKTPGGAPWASRGAAIAGMYNGDAQVISIGGDDRIYHNARFANGAWQGWNPVTTVKARSVATAAMPNGDMQLVIVGLDGKLYHTVRYLNGNWQAWNTLAGYEGGNGFEASAIAVAGMPNGDAQFMAVGNDGRTYHNIRYANGNWQGWSPVYGIQGAVSLGVTGMANGDAQFVSVAPDGSTFHNIRYTSGNWEGWQLLDFTAKAAAITRAGTADVHILVGHR
ncbi:FG-GAP-like repeat-containing protein [Streptomyces sp. NBC_01006]|uniref:FG-GAP-like repeat-containing protein n=1 Tax=Streptomyces sp. NBC_01006 TaxID=2903716 RepID=UPI00386A1773|nr:FG-GAP-like repeat-containing protein [Streptomyces sp. NBC_01006]